MERKKRDKSARDRNYARQYHVVIDLIWGYLTPTQKAIYPVMERLADYHTRHTNPDKHSQFLMGRIARRARPICQPQVARAIDGLVSWGLVVRKWNEHGLAYYLPRELEIITYLFQRAKREGLPHELFRQLCWHYWVVDVPDEGVEGVRGDLPGAAVEFDLSNLPVDIDDVLEQLEETRRI